MDCDAFQAYLQFPPYGAAREEKRRELTEILLCLTAKHKEACPEYRRVLNALGFEMETVSCLEDIPFLPVRLFKEYELLSVPRGEVVKIMTSSGTTGQQLSKIFLDRKTSANQSKIMTRIVSDFIGSRRLPMIILDTSTVLKDRRMFSARGAGILGFSMFGRDRIYALDEKMKLDEEALAAFLERHSGEDIFLFGFTFMVWQHFYRRLKESGLRLDLSKGTLIHGGGWKKLTSEAVSPQRFKAALRDLCGLERVYDYYGMAEQTGSIYMECPCGHLHASRFSDVIIRDPKDWSACPNGKTGMVEVVSALPGSYPGHALLTEDLGAVLGEDDCPCGRLGKYFVIRGRMRGAELRGCSDTYEQR